MRPCRQALAHLLSVGLAHAQEAGGQSRMCVPCAAFQGPRKAACCPRAAQTAGARGHRSCQARSLQVSRSRLQASPAQLSILTDLQLARCSADPCSTQRGKEANTLQLMRSPSAPPMNDSQLCRSLTLAYNCHMTCHWRGGLAELSPDEGQTSALKGRDACEVKGLANWKLTWLPLLSGRAA